MQPFQVNITFLYKYKGQEKHKSAKYQCFCCSLQGVFEEFSELNRFFGIKNLLSQTSLYKGDDSMNDNLNTDLDYPY
ncbi:hypothetical protein CHH92_18290 [Bacillus sonorensis]|nr:hypothetical protein CHH92_18290 [Bacillus sonorensis]RHJ06631.1 hypothetical protein DW143_19835 [Bacillus sonorensis]GIN68256.1 hypothetical protein J41TS2_36770 [Bacillus sonorensis]